MWTNNPEAAEPSTSKILHLFRIPESHFGLSLHVRFDITIERFRFCLIMEMGGDCPEKT